MNQKLLFSCLALFLFVCTSAQASVRDCTMSDTAIATYESRLPSLKKAVSDAGRTYARGSKQFCVFLEFTQSGIEATCKALSLGPCKQNNGSLLGSVQKQRACSSLLNQVISQQKSCSK